MKKPEVMIIKMQTGWLLRITTYGEKNIAHYNQFSVDKLVQAIQLANVLKMHVDNISDLPLKQYLKSVA